MTTMKALFIRTIAAASFLIATASAIAQPAATVKFTGSDEELGALVAWVVKDKGATEWWFRGGAEAAQDVFVTELVATGKVSVVEREQLQAVLLERVRTAGGDIDQDAAATLGRRLGFRYLAVAVVTSVAVVDATARGVVKGRLIDTSTGEIVWADESAVSVGGFGGGVDDKRFFETVLKPALEQLVDKLAAVVR